MSYQNWWLDYAENETDSSIKQEMAMLLEHSPYDREVVENYKLVKQAVKQTVAQDESEDIFQNLDDNFFDKMEQKIMMKIETVDQAAPKASQATRKSESSKRRLWSQQHSWLKSVTAVVMALGSVLLFENPIHSKVLMMKSQLANTGRFVSSEKMVMSGLGSNLDQSVDLLAPEGQSEFFVDVASQKFDDLSKDQFLKLLGSEESISQ